MGKDGKGEFKGGLPGFHGLMFPGLVKDNHLEKLNDFDRYAHDHHLNMKNM